MVWRGGIDRETSEVIAAIEPNWPQWRFRCTDFEKKFIADTLCRWRAYGPQMVMSGRQVNLLEKIYDKIKDNTV